MTEPLPPSRLRTPLLLGGGLMTAFGLWGTAFGTDTDPLRVLVLVVGAALVHDLVLAPVVVAVAWWGRHLLPAGASRALGGGLLVTGTLVAIAVPLVSRPGARADDPSLLPRDYATGLGAALVVAWLAWLVWLLLSRRWASGRRRTSRAEVTSGHG